MGERWRKFLDIAKKKKFCLHRAKKFPPCCSHSSGYMCSQQWSDFLLFGNQGCCQLVSVLHRWHPAIERNSGQRHQPAQRVFTPGRRNPPDVHCYDGPTGHGAIAGRKRMWHKQAGHCQWLDSTYASHISRVSWKINVVVFQNCLPITWTLKEITGNFLAIVFQEKDCCQILDKRRSGCPYSSQQWLHGIWHGISHRSDLFIFPCPTLNVL